MKKLRETCEKFARKLRETLLAKSRGTPQKLNKIKGFRKISTIKTRSFQDRLVMTASIPLRIGFSVRRFDFNISREQMIYYQKGYYVSMAFLKFFQPFFSPIFQPFFQPLFSVLVQRHFSTPFPPFSAFLRLFPPLLFRCALLSCFLFRWFPIPVRKNPAG